MLYLILATYHLLTPCVATYYVPSEENISHRPRPEIHSYTATPSSVGSAAVAIARKWRAPG